MRFKIGDMRYEIGDRRYGGGYLPSLISYLLSPICVPPEGPAARQALVGNAWHAPLPQLLQAPFVHCPWLVPVLAAVVVFCFLRRVGGRDEARPSRGPDEAGPSRGVEEVVAVSANWKPPHLLSPISYLLSLICAIAVGAAVAMTAAPTATALFVLSVLELLAWSCKRRLRDWVFLSFSLAGLLLCGLPYIGWVALMLLLLPLLILADRRSRPRLGGLMFLCLSPVLYAAGCWVLLSYLILDDPFFAWRFIPRLALAPLPREALWTAAAAAAVAAAAEIGDRRCGIGDRRFATSVGAAVGREIGDRRCEIGDRRYGGGYLSSLISYLLSPICAASAALAAAALWFGALSAAGLDWALPWGRPANLPPPDRDAVARHVKEATPWGRVFVCGYAGLGGSCTNAADASLFETCLDPHIGMLRRAYVRQRLYLLVPRPDKENALDPCEWRYDGLYAGGAQRLLFDRDFGAWRLYAVISADGVGGDDGR